MIQIMHFGRKLYQEVRKYSSIIAIAVVASSCGMAFLRFVFEEMVLLMCSSHENEKDWSIICDKVSKVSWSCGQLGLAISTFITTRLGIFVSAVLLMASIVLPKPEHARKSKRLTARKSTHSISTRMPFQVDSDAGSSSVVSASSTSGGARDIRSMAMKVETAEMIISGEDGEAADVCASCGIAEIDEIKLKTCTACKSVRYCSVECQKKHRPQHKRACKKRMAELRDELLFRQPESSNLGDCPICCLPLPLDPQKYGLMPCCSKVICKGCSHANQVRQLGLVIPQEPSCAFCREPLPETVEEAVVMAMKRVEKNDPFAMWQMGVKRDDEGDYKSAFEYWTKAAELGNASAHYNLSVMYRLGQGVEKDEKKHVYHLEVAAIGGHVQARHNLAVIELIDGKMERSVKHFTIAANMGWANSLKNLWKYHARGLVKKEDLNATLRAHQAAVDATKSAQREQAEEILKRN